MKEGDRIKAIMPNGEIEYGTVIKKDGRLWIDEGYGNIHSVGGGFLSGTRFEIMTSRENHIQNLLSIMDGMPSDTCGDWRDSISYAVEQIEKSAWIPCKDELPEDEDTYLVTWRPRYNPFDCNFMWLLSWEGGEWVGDIPSAKYYGDGEYDVLAWMPLPDAYVEGAE